MGFPRASRQSALSRQKSREDLKRKLDDLDVQDSDNSYELRVGFSHQLVASHLCCY
ncbi:hypothetical protein EJ02DRAFT_460242, partial [Clathrospora elynae]